MKIERTTTGLIIHNADFELKRRILHYFSLKNPFREFFIYSGNNKDKVPLFGREHDVIYISSGLLHINDSYINSLPKPSIIQPPTPQTITLNMNRQPRSQLQIDCIKKMTSPTINSYKLTVELKPGTGKEQPYSTKIPTPTDKGYTLMGELKVGDYVFDRWGRPSRILNIFEQGEKDVYKLIFEDGRIAMCGLDHLWSVFTNNKPKYETLQLREIIESLNNGDTYEIPLCKPPQRLTISHCDEIYKFDSPNDVWRAISDMQRSNGNIHINDMVFDKEVILQMLYALGQYAYFDEKESSIIFGNPGRLKIKSVEFSHREQSRCIMVDNPEHLYLTEDYIVTHNTFIATYSIAQLGLKPLIIAPTTLLKNQWCEEFENVGVPRRDIATNITDAPDKKVCVVTISSIENALRDNWENLIDIMNRSNFGIKVIDEAHLHLKGFLRFDAICNIRYNWYLSATLGRSDVQEDSILNRALADADRFIGDSKYEEYQHQYVNVYYQDIYYYPSTQLCLEHFRYGSKGLIKATYYRMLLEYKNGIPFLNNLVYMMKVAKKMTTYEGKILLLVPLIDIIDRVIDLMREDPFFKGSTYSGVDGSMSITEKRQAMECDYILSTSLSMGTGVDVQNLAAVINFDQYSSPIIGEQIFGRLRDRGKDTWYFDITDHVKQAKMLEAWGRKRHALIPYYPGAHSDIKQLPDIKC